jgi:hypothetical protein
LAGWLEFQQETWGCLTMEEWGWNGGPWKLSILPIKSLPILAYYGGGGGLEDCLLQEMAILRVYSQGLFSGSILRVYGSWGDGLWSILDGETAEQVRLDLAWSSGIHRISIGLSQNLEPPNPSKKTSKKDIVYHVYYHFST